MRIKFYILIKICLAIQFCSCDHTIKTSKAIEEEYFHLLFRYHSDYPEIKSHQDAENFSNYVNENFKDMGYVQKQEHEITLDSIHSTLVIKTRNFFKSPSARINLTTEVGYSDWCSNEVANRGVITHHFSSEPKQLKFFRKVHDTLMDSYSNKVGIPVFNLLDSIKVEVKYRLIYKYQYGQLSLHLNCNAYQDTTKISEIQAILKEMTLQKQEYPFDYALIPVGIE